MEQPNIKDRNVVRGLVRKLQAASRPMLRKSNEPAHVTLQGGGPVDDTVTMGPFTLAGDTGSESVAAGNTLSVLGTAPISTAVTATDTCTVTHDATAVTPGSYTNAGITVDQTGHITAAADGAADLWQRTGTLLEPATAQDQVSLTTNALATNTLTVGNTSTGDAVYATSAAGTAVFGNCQGAGAGIGGTNSAAAGAVYAIQGTITSADNAAYSIHADNRTYLGDWADAAELAGAPADPDAGWRLYFIADGVHVVNAAGADVGPLTATAPQVVPTFIFGDGHDGALTKDDGSTTTLTEDKYYSSITLTANSKINTNGWCIFCTGTVDVAAGSEIYCKGVHGGNGGNASGTTQGAAGTVSAASNAAAHFAAGTLGAIGIIGGAVNAAGGPGTAGIAVTNSIFDTGTSSSGGAGGNGGNAAMSGGFAGGVGANTQLTALAGGALRDLPQLMTGCYQARPSLSAGYWTCQASGGSGGAGGGGKTAVTSAAGGGSGASGGGGGVVFIAANTIVNAGAISADGGDGGHGGNGGNGVTNGNGGGGGGGGAGGCGGVVIAVYHTLSGGTAGFTANGGAGGTKGTKGVKAGTGLDGSDGNDGSAGDNGLVLFYVV